MAAKAKKQSTNTKNSKKSLEETKPTLLLDKKLSKQNEPKRDSFSSAKSKKEPIFVLAGEHSGDILGAELLHVLQKYLPEKHFYGIGGSAMEAEGFESIEDIENLSVIGFFEILKKYSFLKKLLERMIEEILARGTKVVILIDYPGFNLRLAEKLKKHNIKVIFYVSPQIWAWKFNRIYHIRKNIDLMLTLFQFEEDLYRKYGVNAYFVGHPIAKRIRDSKKNESAIKLDKTILENRHIIGLLPGSRGQEIKKLTIPLLSAASKISDHYAKGKKSKKFLFLLPNINPKYEAFIQEQIEIFSKKNPNLMVEYAFHASLQVMEQSEILLIASGTATLEATYFAKPMVIVYKVSMLTYLIGSFLLRTKNVGLVNILAGEEVCRELLQAECNGDYISEETIRILDDAKYRKKISDGVLSVKNRELKESDGSHNAAKTIMNYLRSISH